MGGKVDPAVRMSKSGMKKLKQFIATNLARGMTYQQVSAKVVDELGLKCDEARVKRLLLADDCLAMYKEAVKDEAMFIYPEALRAQMDIMRQTDNDWLRQVASRELLNQSRPHMFGDEEKSMTIRIEGMPELGTPDTSLALTEAERAEADRG